MCIHFIGRHINRAPANRIFTTRDFLSYGSRRAVDQALFRMVRSGWIVRVARGVFVKQGTKLPSVLEIASAKAKAFGKQITRHCADLASDLVLTARGTTELTFATSGCTSSFLAGDTRVQMKHIGPRKTVLGDTKAGRAIRALWHLGQAACTAYHVSTAHRSFSRTDYEEFRRSAAWMPAWMTRLFEVRPVYPDPALWDPRQC